MIRRRFPTLLTVAALGVAALCGARADAQVDSPRSGSDQSPLRLPMVVLETSPRSPGYNVRAFTIPEGCLYVYPASGIATTSSPCPSAQPSGR